MSECDHWKDNIDMTVKELENILIWITKNKDILSQESWNTLFRKDNNSIFLKKLRGKNLTNNIKGKNLTSENMVEIVTNLIF